MGDSKYFSRGKAHELKAMLKAAKTSQKKAHKTTVALKRIIANITMGNDMAVLFPEVMEALQVHSLEIKKMVLLFVVFYAKKNTALTNDAISILKGVNLHYSISRIYQTRIQR